MISEALHNAHVARLTSHASYCVEQRMAAKLISLYLSVTCLNSQIHTAVQRFCGSFCISLRISPFLFYAVERKKMYQTNILASCQVLFSLKIIYCFISVDDDQLNQAQVIYQHSDCQSSRLPISSLPSFPLLQCDEPSFHVNFCQWVLPSLPLYVVCQMV